LTRFPRVGDIRSRMDPRSTPRRPSPVCLSLAVAIAIGALGACGCGGQATTSATSASTSAVAKPTPATAPPGSDAFVAHAEAVCRRLNDRLDASAAHKDESLTAIARNARQHAELERRAALELGGLAAPRALARDWERIVAYRRALASELVTLAHTLNAGQNPKTSGLLAAKSTAHAAMSKIARRDGFVDCAKVGSA
jgi:hypothetical protein